MLAKIEKVFQSQAELFLNGKFVVEVAIAKMVSGSGMGRPKSYSAPATTEQKSKRKDSVITIKNTG